MCVHGPAHVHGGQKTTFQVSLLLPGTQELNLGHQIRLSSQTLRWPGVLPLARSPPAGPESSHLKQWSSFPQQVVTKQDIVHTQKEKKITVSEGLSVLHLNSVHFKTAFLEANLHVVQTNTCPQAPSLLQYLQLGAFSTHRSTFSFYTSSSLRVTRTETCP